MSNFIDLFNEDYIKEGKFLNKTREIISGYNWKRKVKNKDFKALTEEKFKYNRIVIHSKSELDKLYNSGAYFIECVSGDEELCQIFSNLLGAHYKIKEPINIYVINGKDFNKAYDLYGDNSYKNDVHHVIIPFKDVSGDPYKIKTTLKARYFSDVVDNNEYREYLAGRHKKSEQIQWLIDAHASKNESYSNFMDLDLFNEDYIEEASLKDLFSNILKKYKKLKISTSREQRDFNREVKNNNIVKRNGKYFKDEWICNIQDYTPGMTESEFKKKGTESFKDFAKTLNNTEKYKDYEFYIAGYDYIENKMYPEQSHWYMVINAYKEVKDPSSIKNESYSNFMDLDLFNEDNTIKEEEFFNFGANLDL